MVDELGYIKLCRKVLRTGVRVEDRTGVGTRALFGQQLRFNLRTGFPLLTTKKIHFKSVAEELFWMMRGETNINSLNATIWDEWADGDGDLGPIYGHQWRSWGSHPGTNGMDYRLGIDQLQRSLDMLKNDPHSRRNIVSAWNVAELDRMALPPCHFAFQFHVARNRVSCTVYQRSCDLFLGVPFNIASYALLTQIMAVSSGREVGELIWNGGDVHIYRNHEKQVEEQLHRLPYDKPWLMFKRIPSSLNEWTFDNLVLDSYRCHPPIKADVAV